MWLTALVATSVLTVSYKAFEFYFNKGSSKKDIPQKKNYTGKTITLTLSHSVLSSNLPLNDILLSSDNVTFILPPYLSLDDLASNIKNNYNLPKTLIQNYKLLRCSNIKGYLSIVKSLKPDVLLVCLDDLGLKDSKKDLNPFVKNIVTIDQSEDDVYSKVYPMFLN